MKITSYGFGNIEIDNKRYTSDLKIVNGKIKSNWWRKDGHRLHLEDIRDIIEAKPKILVVGRGYSGLMRIAEGVEEHLRGLGIEVEALPSKKAVNKFNRLIEEYGPDDVAFAIHLTC